MSSESIIHVFDFLDAPGKFKPAAVCVVFGDEPFLKRLALGRLRQAVLGADQPDAPFATFDGESAEWRDVGDELATVSLFSSGPRLVVVDDADDFVSRYRAELEDYVAKPRKSGVLVLNVTTWASNTRLYKAVAETGLSIECRPPQKKVGRNQVVDDNRIAKWLADWCKSHHDAVLKPSAAQQLIELNGLEFGMLDQDLAKLALFAGRGGAITPELVDEIIGGWRTKTTWELIDAAADGDTAEALRQLDRMLHAGENAVGIFAQISWSLRRFAAATRIYEFAEKTGRKIGLRDALEQAGFRKWPADALPKAEQQLRQLTRNRAGKLYDWLLETDLSLKGTHSSPDRARFALELLFLRMAKGVT